MCTVVAALVRDEPTCGALLDAGARPARPSAHSRPYHFRHRAPCTALTTVAAGLTHCVCGGGAAGLLHKVVNLMHVDDPPTQSRAAQVVSRAMHHKGAREPLAASGLLEVPAPPRTPVVQPSAGAVGSFESPRDARAPGSSALNGPRLRSKTV